MATLVSNEPGPKPYTVQIELCNRSFSQRVTTKAKADDLALTWAREHKGKQVDVFRGRQHIGCRVIFPATS